MRNIWKVFYFPAPLQCSIFPRQCELPQTRVGIFYALYFTTDTGNGVVAIREWFEHHCLGKVEHTERRDTVFCCALTKTLNISMLHNQTEIPASELDEMLDKLNAISFFFRNTYSLAETEEILWDMLSSSITNPDDPSDIESTSRRCFIYRRLIELLAVIQPKNLFSTETSSLS